MSLQVRLRHALGERLLDLADRPAEQPLVVGRAGAADVKIPSVSVAGEHCALFVHEGQWVLQDTSGGATFVNGQPLEGPTPLCVGDVISLGTDASPAMIEVDPAGAALGRTGQPAETRAASGARAAVAPGPARMAAGVYGGAAATPPQVAVPPPVDDGWGAPVLAGDDPFAAWNSPSGQASGAGAAPATPRRKRSTKQSSDAPLIIGIAVCVLIVGIVSWLAYQRMHPPAEAPKPVQNWKAPEDDNAHPRSIFNDGPEPSTPKHRGAAPTPSLEKIPNPPAAPADPDSSESSKATPPAAASSSPPSDKDDKDVHKGDEAWAEVEGAHYTTDYGTALLKFDDYKRQHPGLYTKELDAYTDDALDRLWWKRIAQLCNHRDDLNKQIRAKAKDLRDEPSAAFKKTLTEEKKALEADLAKTLERLTQDMGYTGDQTPDQTNKEMMAKLTAERDRDKFGAWRLRTLNFIRSHHGAAPWDGES